VNPDTLVSIFVVDICAMFVFVDFLLDLPTGGDTHASVFQRITSASTKPQNKM
jgi:hypothetical protein